MAGDWIKMRADLLTHPKVVRMSSALRADRLRITGGLFAVWCLFDTHSIDGQLDGYTAEALDDLIGFPGFSSAMEAVGWLEGSDSCLSAPRFEDHNGQSAKRRAQEAERKRDVRKAPASDADKKRTREDKRREEDTEANASAGKPALEPAEIIFGYGLPLLTNAGTPEKQARSFLGALRKRPGGDVALVNAIRDCLREKPLQPLEWLGAALPPEGQKAKPKAEQITFAEQERRAGMARWEEMTGQRHPELEKLRQGGDFIDALPNTTTPRIEHVAAH